MTRRGSNYKEIARHEREARRRVLEHVIRKRILHVRKCRQSLGEGAIDRKGGRPSSVPRCKWPLRSQRDAPMPNDFIDASSSRSQGRLDWSIQLVASAIKDSLLFRGTGIAFAASANVKREPRERLGIFAECRRSCRPGRSQRQVSSPPDATDEISAAG